MASDEPVVVPTGRRSSSPPPAQVSAHWSADRLPVMLWVTGEGARGGFFNAAWQEFTGRRVEDLLGRGWLGGLHPDDQATVAKAHRDCRAKGLAFELEYRLRGADGLFRWVLSRGSTDPAGGGCVAVAFDITERKRVEEERTDLLASSNEENARLASLQSLTAGLVALTRPNEVAELVLGQGVAELGATTASLCLLGDDRETMVVAAQVGYPLELTERWGRFPLASATPAGDALRMDSGIYISNHEELHARYPIFGGSAMVGDQALAVLPLASDGTGPLGAMVFGFAQPREFAPAERRLLAALAVQASTALARTRSRAALEAAQDQLAFLADASERLAASLDLDETLATVAELAVPRLADRCGVYLLFDGQVRSRLWAPLDLEANPGALADHPVALSDATGIGSVLRTGRGLFAPIGGDAAVAAWAQSEEHHQVLRTFGVGGVVVVPLRARGQLLGALALANRAGHDMTDQERVLADELAARAAVAIDNAQLYSVQVSLAQRLQANLLPPSLPLIDGLDLAARYAPVGSGAEVGGDFYDCIRIGRNRVLLIVGDVKGKGVDAAVLTGMARHVIRAAANTEHRPADILASLNDVLFRQEVDRAGSGSLRESSEGGTEPMSGWGMAEPRFCTVLAVSLTRRGRSFHAVVASAGHPLPLLRHPDGHVAAIGRPGQLLGILPTVDLPQVAVTLAPGSLLVCYTDGVSECHHGTRFFDEDGIIAVLARAEGPAAAVAAEIETAARAFTPNGEVKDDIAILAVGILP